MKGFETSFKTFISIVLNNQQSMKKVLPENLNFLPIYILGMIIILITTYPKYI